MRPPVGAPMTPGPREAAPLRGARLDARRARGDETGALLPLLAGYVLVVAALLAVVVSASAVFLRRQALQGAADGAALAAAQSPDPAVLVAEGVAGRLPLSTGSVDTAVARYASFAGLASRFPGLRWTSSTDGATARVRLVADVPLPLAGWLGPARVRLVVDAAARSPVLG